VKSSPHNYSIIQEWDATRTTELSRKYRPYVQITDAYANLVCEIVGVLGTNKPKSVQDVVVRDLAADTFDALHEARRVILTGKCSIAYPLARRVYESLSLMTLCILDSKLGTKWDSGIEIPNSEVRRELAKHQFGEPEEHTKRLYRFFCLGTHPNRALIPRRFLGEGNQFVLGAIPKPSLTLITEYCMIHLRMWFWYASGLLHLYCDLIDAVKPDFGSRYLRVADAAQKLQAELKQNFQRLLKEENQK
jgi:hypothetical protein